jgi:hypothetical protein
MNRGFYRRGTAGQVWNMVREYGILVRGNPEGAPGLVNLLYTGHRRCYFEKQKDTEEKAQSRKTDSGGTF